MKRRLLTTLALALLVAASLPSTIIGSPSSGSKGHSAKLVEAAPDNVYIVRLAESPAVAYDGGITGYAATAPKNGTKINSADAKVKRYVAYLTSRHAVVMSAAGLASTSKLYSYTYALNGFAAVMSRAQATKVAAMAGVISVSADQFRHKVTDNTPDFLGLNDSDGGLWADMGLTGEDVIVGVVDTGIWPEHPSFSDQTDLVDRPGSSGKRSLAYGPAPAGWNGSCQSGEQWSQDDCNNKLIGARYFLAGFEKHGIIKQDFKSARDADGHGTHTASTAAGNAGVEASILGADYGVVSGIAPRARVAMYKALWNDDGGYETDLAAAIDTAVSDGVDVLSYSIGSDNAAYFGNDDIAFLFATQRNGVFASVAAGNAGPRAGTVGSPAAVPWVMAVGASTQDRTFEGSVTLGNAATYSGVSVTGGTGLLPIVDAATIPAAGASAGQAELCLVGALNPSAAAGKIVLCKRGSNDRVDKSEAVLVAGGAGMVLYNANATQSLLSDNHWVPSVHISYGNGLLVKLYAATVGATASIIGGTTTTSQGSVMADFSSRGPNVPEPDFLRPDVTAPGVNILAGNTPRPFSGAPGQLFQAISGTSMSTPHVAGLAALLKEAHPNWGADEIKSALMLTARQDVFKEDGSTPADAFDYGAGHVVPNSAVNPGVVMTETLRNFARYTCNDFAFIWVPGTCEAIGTRSAASLNLPSIAVSELVGERTLLRTFQSVDGVSRTWTASVEGLAGIDVDLPDPIVLAAGASATWAVKFTTDTADIGEWVFGALVFTDDNGRHVRMPVVLKPNAIGAPALASTTTSTSSAAAAWSVTAGYTGDLSANGWGLAADAAIGGQTVAQDPDQDVSTDLFGIGQKSYNFTLDSNDRYFAVGTMGSTTTPGSDLDVFLFAEMADGSAGYSIDDLIGFAADSDSDEIVEMVLPDAGNYRVVVHGWGTPGGAGSTYTLHQWIVDTATADGGSLVATAGAGDPTGVVAADVVSITAVASGLTSVGQYRGLVTYSDGIDSFGATIVVVTRQ